jgi:hypothetical protein
LKKSEGHGASLCGLFVALNKAFPEPKLCRFTLPILDARNHLNHKQLSDTSSSRHSVDEKQFQSGKCRTMHIRCILLEIPQTAMPPKAKPLAAFGRSGAWIKR